MQKQCFNNDWDFIFGSGFHKKGNPEKVNLPHDFIISQPRSKDSVSNRDCGYFPGGMGWYSKKFYAPEEWKEKVAYVEFEGVYMNSEIKLNGNVIKRQNYGYTTFLCNLNKYIEYGKENELEVLADNTSVPNSRWYSGAGIYRYVWFYLTNKPHIDWHGVYITTKSVADGKAVINIETTVAKSISENMTVEHIITNNTDEIIKTAYSPAAEGNKCNTDIEIPNPSLWDIDSPNLYKVTTNLYLNGELKDTDETMYGIRTFSLSAKGFILNGRNIKLKGGCVHHDNGILGSASYVRSEERKIELLKKSGFNSVRTAHNPPAPAFLDACDRLGMIVMDEAFDCWREEKKHFDYHREFDRDWEHDLTSMVMRDRNHPSILMWSIGNEITEQSGRSGAKYTSKMLADKIRELDSRPVGMAVCVFHGSDYTKEMPEFDKVVEHLDFVGYNYQHQAYEKAHELYPNRAIIGTETVPKEIFESWTATEKLDHVLGDFVWTAIDYLGEAGIGRVYYTQERPEIEWHLYDYPWNHAYCGDIDICGFKRPQSYYRDILWGVSDKPKMFVRRPSRYSHESERVTFWGWHDGIEGWNFPGNEGKELIVDVYTPAKSVDLYLNGIKIETREVERLTASFKVTYTAGELKAVDSNGSEVILKTAKPAAKINLSADRLKINSCADLSYVTAEIIDGESNIVTCANNKVTFIVEGTGTLLAVGSANPKTEEMYKSISHSAYDGKLMAVVKSTGEGEIKLTAYSNGLLSGTIIISAGKQ